VRSPVLWVRGETPHLHLVLLTASNSRAAGLGEVIGQHDEGGHTLPPFNTHTHTHNHCHLRCTPCGLPVEAIVRTLEGAV
jgi:hypothetical protein